MQLQKRRAKADKETTQYGVVKTCEIKAMFGRRSRRDRRCCRLAPSVLIFDFRLISAAADHVCSGGLVRFDAIVGRRQETQPRASTSFVHITLSQRAHLCMSSSGNGNRPSASKVFPGLMRLSIDCRPLTTAGASGLAFVSSTRCANLCLCSHTVPN